MPRVSLDGFALISMIDNTKAIASEAIPFCRGRGATRIHDLQIDRKITREGLRVTFRIDEEAAIIASYFKVATP